MDDEANSECSVVASLEALKVLVVTFNFWLKKL